jgi:hypothetical protein
MMASELRSGGIAIPTPTIHIIVMMMGHNTPKHIEVNKLFQSKYMFS